ncbi:MAG TPA: hypothetical protein VFQ23_10535 [Anaerolineales bacterium]|nr:hypothetical protein [Anaerolineales bacterium]
MDKKNIQAILKDELEMKIPSTDVRLWHAVKEDLVAGKTFQQGEKMNTIYSRRIPRVLFVLLILVALFSLAFVTPQGRAFAQSILQFFTRAESNTFPLQPSQVGQEGTDPSIPTAEPPAPILTMAEVEAQAGFDAAELPFIPKGFNYLGTRLYGQAISIEYEAQGGGGNLIIMQSQAGFIQSEWDSVPAESIVPVKIGETDAEFAQGTFVVYPGETLAKWNPDAPILRLRWVKDGIAFEVTKFGNVEAIQYLDQSALIQLAESLSNKPFAAPLSEVEKRAGFDILEAAQPPDGMKFLGASFDPIYSLVSLSYGYSADDRRILIKQQPVSSGENCDLCGIVGASAAVQIVQIGEVAGEYAEGVWELTDNGPVWRDDPYLKTLRWQKDGMAFELIFMGVELEKDDLVDIATNLK